MGQYRDFSTTKLPVLAQVPFAESFAMSSLLKKLGIKWRALYSEPRPGLVFVPEFSSEYLLFLPRTVNLQGNDRHKHPEKFRQGREEETSRDGEGTENVDRVSDSRI